MHVKKLIALLLLLSACRKDPAPSGPNTSNQTDHGWLKEYMVGTPIEGAAILLYDFEAGGFMGSYKLIDSTKTDVNGYFHFNKMFDKSSLDLSFIANGYYGSAPYAVSTAGYSNDTVYLYAVTSVSCHIVNQNYFNEKDKLHISNGYQSDSYLYGKVDTNIVFRCPANKKMTLSGWYDRNNRDSTRSKDFKIEYAGFPSHQTSYIDFLY